jgi:hypothetical protein
MIIHTSADVQSLGHIIINVPRAAVNHFHLVTLGVGKSVEEIQY